MGSLNRNLKANLSVLLRIYITLNGLAQSIQDYTIHCDTHNESKQKNGFVARAFHLLCAVR